MEQEKKEERKLECEEIIMITQDGCPVCTEVKGLLQGELEQGEIKVKRIEDEEGGDIANKLGIDGVPSFVCKIDDGTFREMGTDELRNRFQEKGDVKS